MRRQLIVSLTLIVMVSMLAMSAYCAIATPSVPEFTLRYVDNSYKVPPTDTYTTDPYTGKVTTSTTPGYYSEKISVQVIITNPSFSSYKDENGSNVDLYFQVLVKGHYEETWTGISNNHSGYDLFNDTSSTTIIHATVYNVSAGGQVDVQVRALIGKFMTVCDPPVPPFSVIPSSHEVFVGEASDWSNIQTITIGETANQTMFGLDYVTFIILVVVVLAIALSAFTLYTRKP